MYMECAEAMYSNSHSYAAPWRVLCTEQIAADTFDWPLPVCSQAKWPAPHTAKRPVLMHRSPTALTPNPSILTHCPSI